MIRFLWKMDDTFDALPTTTICRALRLGCELILATGTGEQQSLALQAYRPFGGPRANTR
jgi:hypothetical protein